jgi:uncharacterized protein (TIGR03083 family)
MSQETLDDARRVARLSRAEYDDLLAYLERLPADGWTEQSACADWRVYQVASHIGSGQLINRSRFEAGLRDADALTEEQRKAIWAHFDSLDPDEMLPAFRKANDEYFELIDSLSSEELSRFIPWLIGSVPVATALAFRLNEQALHSWDIRWARDRRAALSPTAAPDLLDLNLSPTSVSGLVKPERAERLSGSTIQFVLSEPDGATTLELHGDGVVVSHGRGAGSDLTVELPAEAFIRLLWGRYDVPAGLRSGQLRLSRPELADALSALFPGR